MSENAKKAGLIAITIVAIVGAVFGAMRFFGGEQMEVENTIAAPPGHKSEKQLALEAQQQSTGSAQSTGKEADLGGDLSGR